MWRTWAIRTWKTSKNKFSPPAVRERVKIGRNFAIFGQFLFPEKSLRFFTPHLYCNITEVNAHRAAYALCAYTSRDLIFVGLCWDRPVYSQVRSHANLYFLFKPTRRKKNADFFSKNFFSKIFRKTKKMKHTWILLLKNEKFLNIPPTTAPACFF